MKSLPSLTLLDDTKSTQNHFFSEQANWVVPGVVMAGQSPAQAKDVKAYIKDLSTRAKITTYVCLQCEVVPQSSDTEDLGGIQIGNDSDILPSYANTVSQVNPAAEPKFVYYGMKDDEIAPSDEGLQSLVENLSNRVHAGEILYIHCKGGSGRTGIVAACLLGALYPENAADEALERIQTYFEMRCRGVGNWVNPKRKSPANDEQKDQVRKLIAIQVEKKESADTAVDVCNPCAIRKARNSYMLSRLCSRIVWFGPKRGGRSNRTNSFLRFL
jgi:hypothetical protein